MIYVLQGKLAHATSPNLNPVRDLDDIRNELMKKFKYLFRYLLTVWLLRLLIDLLG